MVHTKLRPYEVWEPPTGGQRMTRRLHELLPLGLQHALRDRYLGSAFDGGVKASALLVGLRYPTAVLKYLSLGRSAEQHRYGFETPRQTVEVHRCGVPGAPVLVFMHGGAWYSGRPWMYRLMAAGVLQQGLDFCVVGYNTYAGEDTVAGHVDHQVDDLQAALEFLMGSPDSPYNKPSAPSTDEGAASGSSSQPPPPPPPFFLVGHSSGAHVAALLLVRQAMGWPGHNTLPRPVAGFVGLAGVYDVDEHYAYEARRGVHEISGLKPANGGVSSFNRYSPTFLAGLLKPDQAAKLPPMLLVHGTDDDTVPFTNSLCFHNILRARGCPALRSLWARGCNHQDPVTAFMDLKKGTEIEKVVAEFVHSEPRRPSSILLLARL